LGLLCGSVGGGGNGPPSGPNVTTSLPKRDGLPLRVDSRRGLAERVDSKSS